VSRIYLHPAAPVPWVNIGHPYVGKTPHMWVKISWVTAWASRWLGIADIFGQWTQRTISPLQGHF